jgi:hypothetical protein
MLRVASLAAAVSVSFSQIGQVLADGCARSSHASTGAMGGAVSSFVELGAPLFTIGLLTWAVSRARGK